MSEERPPSRLKGRMGGSPPGGPSPPPRPSPWPSDGPPPNTATPPPAGADPIRALPPTAPVASVEEAAPAPGRRRRGRRAERSAAPAAETGGACRKRRWKLPAAAIVLTVVALVLGGTLIGYRVAQDRVRPSRAPAPVVIEEVALDEDQLDEPPVRMSDVVGLTRDEALEALADAGIDTSRVTFDERPFVGEEGRVVVQSPVRGQPDPGEVVLTLSTPATVPEVVGRPVEEVAEQLEALGAIVVRTDVYRPAATTGSVVTVTPAVGAALATEVTVEVAAPPSSIFLTSLEPVDGSCYTGSDTVDTVSSDAALSCSESYSDEPSVGYDLGRRADRFRATAGISNSGEVGSRVRLRLLVDGVEKHSVELVFGTAVPIEIDVTGGLRLEIVVEDVNPDDDDYDTADAVLLDAALLGAPDAIAGLGAGT